MFKWKKLGKIFDPTTVKNRSWMKEFAQAPTTLIFKDFIRVYFSCRPYPEPSGMVVSYTGFVDLDRHNLFKIIRISKDPVLPLGDIGAFDEFGIMPFSVIKKQKKIIAYYGGWTRCESTPFNIAIGLAESTDNGVNFQKIGKGPLLSYSLEEPFLIGVPRIRSFNNCYYLWYTAGKRWITVNNRVEAVYKIHMAISNDGINWERDSKDIIIDKLDRNEAQASPDVFYYKGKYHMFFCYRYTSDFRANRDRAYRIGYAYSDDLTNWTRDD